MTKAAAQINTASSQLGQMFDHRHRFWPVPGMNPLLQ